MLLDKYLHAGTKPTGSAVVWIARDPNAGQNVRFHSSIAKVIQHIAQK